MGIRHKKEVKTATLDLTIKVKKALTFEDFLYALPPHIAGTRGEKGIVNIGTKGSKGVADLLHLPDKAKKFLSQEKGVYKNITNKKEDITVFRVIEKETPLEIGETLYLSEKEAKIWKGWEEDITGNKYRIKKVTLKKEDLIWKGGLEVGYSPKAWRDEIVSLRHFYNKTKGMEDYEFEGMVPKKDKWLVEISVKSPTYHLFEKKLQEEIEPSITLDQTKTGWTVLLKHPLVKWGVIKKKTKKSCLVETIINGKTQLLKLHPGVMASKHDLTFLRGKDDRFIKGLYARAVSTAGIGLVES